MRILHLTDIHFSKEKEDDFNNIFLNAFLKDIRGFHNDKSFDIVIITGDLIDRGGKSFENENSYTEFEKKFLKPIIDTIKIDKQNIIFIPGNHDVDEQNIDRIYESGLQNELVSIEEINVFVKKENKDIDKLGVKRLKRFHEFKRNYYKRNKSNDLSCFESLFYRTIDNRKIGFAAINTAWRCSRDLPADKLVIGTIQITEALCKLNNNRCDFNIFLMHHPLDLISEIERYEINSLFQQGDVGVLFCGHSHKSGITKEIGNYGSIHYCRAKSGFSNPRERLDQFKPGYIVFDIDLNTLNSTTYFRKFVYDRLEFDKDVDVAKDGQSSIKLTANEKKKEFYELIEINNKTLEIKKDELNHSLLTFGTDSIAPKELTKIFVLPVLTDSPETLGDVDDEKRRYSLSELILEEKNILIIGEKESGKTTLSNRIYYEVSVDFPKYQQIPVIIDYSSLAKKEVKKLIKDYLHEPSDKIETLLNKGKILIIIDNLEPLNNEKYSLSRLRSFIENYSLNKVIATTSTSFDLLISYIPDLFNINIKYHFKPIFIGSVGVKEFKKLAFSWFSKKDQEWLIDNIEKLIKVFETLRIPHTFFSVTLYLWIIEKQENFNPINKYVLVKQFLRYILEGLKLEEAIAGSYNFERKIEILTEIALKMYWEGDSQENYGLSETDTIKVIENHFKLNQLNLSPTDKLTNLITHGILHKNKESNLICFRFEAFFKYFLSLNIEKDIDFKKHVFSDEYFLAFVDELDYYTGRLRNEKETLNFVLEKLRLSFEEIDAIISDNLDEYIPKDTIILKHIKSNSIIEEARENKLSNNEIEEVLDDQMNILPVDKSIRVKKKSKDYKKQFNRALELAARVLKNSENIKDPELINNALDQIIKKSAKYGLFIHSVVIGELKKGNLENFPIPPQFFFFIAPIINQLMLLSWLGTYFIEMPLRNKLNKIYSLPKKEMSEYELYLCSFLFSDMKFYNHIDVIDNLINKVDNKFILELSFFKLILYYMMRPEGSSLLSHYERLMEKILIKARGLNKSKAENIVQEKIRKKKIGEKGENDKG